MEYIDITSTEVLVPPYNILKVNELRINALIQGGYTIPPVVPIEIMDGDENISVQAPEGEYTQQQINAIVAILNAVALDPTRNNQTQAQTNAAYVALNLQYEEVFKAASNLLETGIMGLPLVINAAFVTAYRNVLSDAVAALAPLAGTPFQTHFSLESLGRGFGLVPNPQVLPQAQLPTFDSFLHEWLNARKVDAVIAHLNQGE